MKYLIPAILIFGFASCTLFNNSSQSTEEKRIDYGDTLELYYGSSTVGYALFKSKTVAYDYGDYDLARTLIEEITYRDIRYRFEFRMVSVINEITMLRYRGNSDTLFYPNDSYTLINDDSGVYMRFYGEDGETVIRERQVKDGRIIANTQELFRYCNSYLSSYFMMLEDPKARELRKNRIQSLGYELLKFERM